MPEGAAGTPAPMPATAGREAVVLVHGLWMSPWVMGPLARRLEHCGYAAHRFGYRSVHDTLERSAARLDAFVAGLDAAVVHFLGHSLGGIVIRALFHHYPDQRPGRIVTLGSPHRGAYAAGRLARYRLGRRLVGRSIAQLVDGAPLAWPLPAREIGVIAGRMPIGVGRIVPRLPRPNDGVVALQETCLPGAADFLVLPVTHTQMLISPAVARAACRFLATGRFA